MARAKKNRDRMDTPVRGTHDSGAVDFGTCVPILAVLGSAAALVYLPSTLDSNIGSVRAWGFHFSRYLPGWLSLACFIFAASLVLTRVRGILTRALGLWGCAIASPEDPAWRRRVGDVILPALCFAVFWAVRSRYVLLGDNLRRLDQALNGTLVPYEFGTMLLAHHAIRIGQAVAGLDPRVTLAFMNTLAGFPFAVAATLLARTLGSTNSERGLVHLGLLGLGGVQLFCGYVEMYSWAFAMLAVYLASTLKALRGSPIAWAFGFFLLSAGLHLVALLFAPPLLFLVAHRHRCSRQEHARGLTPADPACMESVSTTHVRVMILAVFAVGAILPLAMPSLLHEYSSHGAKGLTLLSPTLWWEKWNGVVLASPIGSLLGIPLMIWAIWCIGVFRRRIGPVPLLCLSAAVPCLFSLWAMRTGLGSLDWDIMSFAGLPLFLWSAAVVLELRREHATSGNKGPAGREKIVTAHDGRTPVGRLSALFLALTVVSLGNTWSFVLVNSGEASIQRVRDILHDDPADYWLDHSPHLHLGLMLRANGLYDEAIATWCEGAQEHPQDPNIAYNLSAAYWQEGQLEEARRWAIRAWNIEPRDIRPIFMIYCIETRKGDLDGQYKAAGTIVEFSKLNPEAAAECLGQDKLDDLHRHFQRLKLQRENSAGQAASEQ